MQRDFERKVVFAVQEALNCSLHDGRDATPAWLMRPGADECGTQWKLVRSIYTDLTGLELPDTMPPTESRHVDGILEVAGAPPRILEVDERQHFNQPRATTLRRYPERLALGFPRDLWLERSAASRRTLTGTSGFDAPRPPLFREPGGRHLQRAFRDSLTDVLPELHGWAPTLRIAFFEVRGWIDGPDAIPRMRALLEMRGITAGRQGSRTVRNRVP